MVDILSPEVDVDLPDDTQLPATDGNIANNFQEHPQSMLLTGSLRPVLDRLYPDRQYAIGQDCGIYWRPMTDPFQGCKAPDWFLVPGVSPLLNDRVRRSYVMWREIVAPLIVIEFVSDDGSEERDQTPFQGKFWVYEQGIRAPYYAIYEVALGSVDVYRLVDGVYQPVPANSRGHYPVVPLGIELGSWLGTYQNQNLPWLRCWDSEGRLLPTTEEREEAERQAREKAEQQLAKERSEKERLQTKLRALGIDPDQP